MERKLDTNRKISDDPQASLQAINVSKGDTVLAHSVEWAGTSEDRRRGLLGRTELNPRHGIYIVPCQGVHTFRMKFPIDLVFIGSEGRVVAIQHSLKPNRISKIIFRAKGVLELAAGRLHETDLAIGDMIEFREVDSNDEQSTLH